MEADTMMRCGLLWELFCQFIMECTIIIAIILWLVQIMFAISEVSNKDRTVIKSKIKFFIWLCIPIIPVIFDVARFLISKFSCDIKDSVNGFYNDLKQLKWF